MFKFSEKVDKLIPAFMAVKSQIPVLPKNEMVDRGSGGRYPYLKIDDLIHAINAARIDHGIDFVQHPYNTSGDSVGITTMIIHESGQWLQANYEVRLPSEERAGVRKDGQAFSTYRNIFQDSGAGISYARRYALGAVFGVVNQEDDDANSVTDGEVQITRYPSRTDLLNEIYRMGSEIAGGDDEFKERLRDNTLPSLDVVDIAEIETVDLVKLKNAIKKQYDGIQRQGN